METLRPTRRWFQFNLRSLFVLTTLVCISIPLIQWGQNWVRRFQTRNELIDWMPESYSYYAQQPAFKARLQSKARCAMPARAVP